MGDVGRGYRIPSQKLSDFLKKKWLLLRRVTHRTWTLERWITISAPCWTFQRVWPHHHGLGNPCELACFPMHSRGQAQGQFPAGAPSLSNAVSQHCPLLEMPSMLLILLPTTFLMGLLYVSHLTLFPLQSLSFLTPETEFETRSSSAHSNSLFFSACPHHAPQLSCQSFISSWAPGGRGPSLILSSLLPSQNLADRDLR